MAMVSSGVGMWIGLSLSTTAILAVLFLYIPWQIIFCTAMFFYGLHISVAAIDEQLTKTGLQSFLPRSWKDALTSKDLFEVWVDFVRENNPFIIFLRLSALKIFDLNREESFAVMNDISPFLSSLKGKSALALLPKCISRRFDPQMELSEVCSPKRCITTQNKKTLSQVIYRVMEARIKVTTYKLVDPLKKAIFRAIFFGLLISLVARWSPQKRSISLTKFLLLTISYLLLRHVEENKSPDPVESSLFLDSWFL
jgi:hypothetical protein